ncbi:MAG: 6,7-dimethyl-8-ribityllumazine synthase [bacterium]
MLNEKVKDVNPDKSNLHIGIIVSRFNSPITENLLSGALAAFENNELRKDNTEVFYVPGAFEIPVTLKKLCRKNSEKKKFDAFIAIGCVIKGETAHFEYICNSVSSSINKISCRYEIPVGFCLLTCYTAQQAYERSGNPADADNNKGYEAAVTVLEMTSSLNKI